MAQLHSHLQNIRQLLVVTYRIYDNLLYSSDACVADNQPSFLYRDNFLYSTAACITDNQPSFLHRQTIVPHPQIKSIGYCPRTIKENIKTNRKALLNKLLIHNLAAGTICNMQCLTLEPTLPQQIQRPHQIRPSQRLESQYHQ